MICPHCVATHIALYPEYLRILYTGLHFCLWVLFKGLYFVHKTILTSMNKMF